MEAARSSAEDSNLSRLQSSADVEARKLTKGLPSARMSPQTLRAETPAIALALSAVEKRGLRV